MSLLSSFADAKTVKTPAAVMQTLVSPSTGPELPFAAWWTELADDTPGPNHTIDSDQLVVVTAGSVAIQLGDDRFTLAAGDALKLPAGVARVIRALAGRARTLTIGYPNACARVGEGEPVLVPWTV
jgi:quercetin dioxygenase-like cupin family protein